MKRKSSMVVFLAVLAAIGLPVTPEGHSQPHQEWLFRIGPGQGSFAIRPFAVNQPAEMDILVEWLSISTKLEVALYNPGAAHPVFRGIRPSPVRFHLKTSDVYPWKGLWKVVIRNVEGTTSYQGRITLFLDYSYKPPKETSLPPEKPATPSHKEKRASTSEWGLTRIDLSVDPDTRQANVTVSARLPKGSTSHIQLELKTNQFTVDHTADFASTGGTDYRAIAGPFPVLLGPQCYHAKIKGKSIDTTWRTDLDQCFNITCQPQTVIEPIDKPLPKKGAVKSLLHPTDRPKAVSCIGVKPSPIRSSTAETG